MNALRDMIQSYTQYLKHKHFQGGNFQSYIYTIRQFLRRHSKHTLYFGSQFREEISRYILYSVRHYQGRNFKIYPLLCQTISGKKFQNILFILPNNFRKEIVRHTLLWQTIQGRNFKIYPLLC